MRRLDLKYLNDVCPVYTDRALPPYDATHWAAVAAIGSGQPILFDQGFSMTVFNNPLISWRRAFTTDNLPPPTATSTSLISVDEWVPAFQSNVNKHGFRSFGAPRLHGIAEVPLVGSVSASWRNQAKRHLKIFQKQSDITLRLGRLDEIKTAYAKSNIPRSLQKVFIDLTLRHQAAHPETIEVLIADSLEHGIVACFVAGECQEASTSFYLLGFYLPEAKKSHAMVGLVNYWFERTREKQLKLCNFGDMCGPNPLPFQSDIGYSLFKTHFGISRVHYPGSHWKIRLGKLRQ